MCISRPFYCPRLFLLQTLLERSQFPNVLYRQQRLTVRDVIVVVLVVVVKPSLRCVSFLFMNRILSHTFLLRLETHSRPCNVVAGKNKTITTTATRSIALHRIRTNFPRLISRLIMAVSDLPSHSIPFFSITS